MHKRWFKISTSKFKQLNKLSKELIGLRIAGMSIDVLDQKFKARYLVRQPSILVFENQLYIRFTKFAEQTEFQEYLQGNPTGLMAQKNPTYWEIEVKNPNLEVKDLSIGKMFTISAQGLVYHVLALRDAGYKPAILSFENQLWTDHALDELAQLLNLGLLGYLQQISLGNGKGDVQISSYTTQKGQYELGIGEDKPRALSLGSGNGSVYVDLKSTSSFKDLNLKRLQGLSLDAFSSDYARQNALFEVSFSLTNKYTMTLYYSLI